MGAAIGGTVSAINCSGANEVGCGRAVAQGAAVQMGIVSGASAWASSVVSSAFDRGNEWYRLDKSFGEDLKNGVIGGLVGVAFGTISGIYQYDTNSAYQWKTHENVLKYALKRYNPENGFGSEYILNSADYVYKIEGGVEQVDFQLQEQGKGSNYNYEKNLISLDDADIKTPSKLYSTVAHEMRHKPLWEKLGALEIGK